MKKPEIIKTEKELIAALRDIIEGDPTSTVKSLTKWNWGAEALDLDEDLDVAIGKLLPVIRRFKPRGRKKK